MIIRENDHDHDPDATDRAAAARAKLQAAARGPVVTIELTPEQQAALYEQTGGRIDATALKLRPDLDLAGFLSEITDLDRSDVQTGFAPPPKGSAWVVQT